MDRRRLHPVLAYKKKYGLSWDRFAALCAERGYGVSGKQLRYIGKKERRPGWALANFLAGTVLDDGTTAEDLMNLGPVSIQRAA